MAKLFASLSIGRMAIAVLVVGQVEPARAGSLAPAIHFDADNLVTGWVLQSDTDDFWQPFQTQGWTFFLWEPALLTHLAMYDHGGDGLQDDFRVGLWGPQDFFADGVVSGGVESPLVGSWRVVDIPDVLLKPGGYIIGERLQSQQNEDWRATNDIWIDLCETRNFGCDSIPPHPVDVIEDQFFWNFSVLGGHDALLIPNDPRVDVRNSSPVTNGEFSSVDYAEFSVPTNGYLVQGAFVGPNFFLAPVPEPATGVSLAVAFAIGAPFLVGRTTGWWC